IVTHHPIFFHSRKNIREDDAEGAAVCALIRERLALIAAHTNFDNASPGVNDALADALALQRVEEAPHGMRVGWLDEAVSVERLVWLVEEKLATRVRFYAVNDKPIRRVAVLGGAGGDFYEEAMALGADAFVTGEVKHHEALAACAQGLCMIEAGHYETEHIAIKLLANRLQARFDALQYNVTVAESRLSPYMRQTTQTI
ncbi:MAG: Nif3-like dinuclear metal center hexameric protein, partial [Clostridia bacterium]|nr:Nif3-like dinuclear metal center hexameric protein [Clostridia bacterium]